MLKALLTFFEHYGSAFLTWLTNFFNDVVAPLGVAIAREVFDGLIAYFGGFEPTRRVTAA
jgi:hypothetical protein